MSKYTGLYRPLQEQLESYLFSDDLDAIQQKIRDAAIAQLRGYRGQEAICCLCNAGCHRSVAMAEMLLLIMGGSVLHMERQSWRKILDAGEPIFSPELKTLTTLTSQEGNPTSICAVACLCSGL